MRTTWSIVMAIVLCSACSSGKNDSDPPPVVEPAEAPKKQKPVQEYFDPEGNLKASDETYGALTLPQGLTLHREEKFLRVYRTHIPAKDVIAFFGPKLVTGRVDEVQGGAIYRRATVRGIGAGSPFKLDVAVQQLGRNVTRVAITQIPPKPTGAARKVAPPEERRDYWQTMQ